MRWLDREGSVEGSSEERRELEGEVGHLSPPIRRSHQRATHSPKRRSRVAASAATSTPARRSRTGTRRPAVRGPSHRKGRCAPPCGGRRRRRCVGFDRIGIVRDGASDVRSKQLVGSVQIPERDHPPCAGDGNARADPGVADHSAQASPRPRNRPGCLRSRAAGPSSPRTPRRSGSPDHAALRAG